MANTNFNTVNNTNTIVGMVNQLGSQMGSNFIDLSAVSINTKYNNNPNVLPAPGVHPTVKYFGIGINGFFNVNSGTLAQPYVPSEENLDLYLPLPIRVVPVENDLDYTVPGFQYRMRTRETINGLDYFLYWLKLIDFGTQEVDIQEIDLITNVAQQYVFNAGNLFPTPTQTSAADLIASATSKVVVKTSGSCVITGAEVAEGINVIHAGDSRLARISEFGFYTGIDNLSASGLDDVGGAITYPEAIYTHLATHRCSTGSDLSDVNTIYTENITYSNGSTFLQ